MSASLPHFLISAGRISADVAARFYRHVFPRGQNISSSGVAILLPAHGIAPAGHLLPIGGRPCLTMSPGGRSQFGHHLAPVRKLASRIGVLFACGWRGSG